MIDSLFHFFKAANVPDEKLSEDLRKFLEFAKEYNNKKQNDDDNKD